MYVVFSNDLHLHHDYLQYEDGFTFYLSVIYWHIELTQDEDIFQLTLYIFIRLSLITMVKDFLSSRIF